MKTLEQTLRDRISHVCKENAGLRRRLKLMQATCDKRKKQMQEDAKFKAIIKEKDSAFYYAVVSILAGGPSKSCFECRENGIDCDNDTDRGSIECQENRGKEKR